MKLFNEEKSVQEKTVENQRFKGNQIEGFPELAWKGKKPYLDTRFFPAQLKERHGEEKNGWINKLFWGDNLQVMAYLLREYRGKIKLIYIDPPFDSKADYKKTIKLRGESIKNDQNTFEEKQYSDIWNNGEYLQFMYERLILLRELLSDDGTIYLHCDWHKVHHLRCIMDEVFGTGGEDGNSAGFKAEIIWKYSWGIRTEKCWNRKHDNILMYTKTSNFTFNANEVLEERQMSESTKQRLEYKGALIKDHNNRKEELALPSDVWYVATINGMAKEKTNYPTQKPEELIEKIVKASSNPGDIVFDCFMGSGTTQAVAMKLGRKFIGTDINMGAIQTTTRRLQGIKEENKSNENLFTGFEVYNVNNYDFFRNPIQAKELLLEAYEIEKFDNGSVFDGQKEGRVIKIMPTNRITTKGDLQPLISNFNYKLYDERRRENPMKPVESLTLICMGHESDLKASFEEQVYPYKFDLKVIDVLKDRTDINFERDSEADVQIKGDKLVINSFYPKTLLNKLGEESENIEDWRVLVDSILIDWNYDGAILEPSIFDIPDKKEVVKGEYEVPEDCGTIRIKITDLLSNSLELEVKNG